MESALPAAPPLPPHSGGMSLARYFSAGKAAPHGLVAVATPESSRLLSNHRKKMVAYA
jgi:hypothetical protein